LMIPIPNQPVGTMEPQFGYANIIS
jgi:hypothetical protein